MARLMFGVVTPSTKAFTFVPTRRLSSSTTFYKTRLGAGGFEWEDPADAFNQGVENPFKNPELMEKGEDGLKIDPGRLLAPRLEGSNVYLIGMMGSGKSAVADILARRMGTYNFLDTDTIIEKATSMTIPEIFDAEGEEGFRKVEAQILDTVHSYGRCVVATGGGIVIRPLNWSKLQTGIVVWLDVEPETIMKRIEGTDRPLLQTDNPLETITNLLKERKIKYEQGDVAVKVTEDMDEQTVADVIVEKLHYLIDDNPPAWKIAKAKAQAEGLDWVK